MHSYHDPAPFPDRSAAARHLARRQELIETAAAGGCDGALVPATDRLQNEYPAYDRLPLNYLFGFGGSAGVAGKGFRPFAIVSSSATLLVVDGRYTLEAARTLEHQDAVVMEWPRQEGDIREVLAGFRRLAFDPGSFIPQDTAVLLCAKCDVELIGSDMTTALIGAREQEHPAPGRARYVKDLARFDALERLRETCPVVKGEGFFSENNEFVSHIFGLRGSIGPFNPFAEARMLVKDDSILLDAPLSPSDAEELSRDLPDVTLVPHGAFDEETLTCRILKSSPGHLTCLSQTRYASSSTETVSIVDVERRLMVKSGKQIASTARCLALDCGAISEFIHFLRHDPNALGKSEVELGDVLEDLRRRRPGYVGRSFPWSVSFDANAALPHYKARRGGSFERDTLCLFDTGAQFVGGTTDITRCATTAGSQSRERFAEDYTRVLQCHIDLAQAVFFGTTTGSGLDLITRQRLLRNGQNYEHGTGHGIGFVGNVHEGNFAISPRNNQPGFVPGMLFSNEPGYYVEGQHGIRLENMVVVVQDGANLRLDTISFVPFEPSLILRGMLSQNDMDWLRNYYDKMIVILKDHVRDDVMQMIVEDRSLFSA